MTSKAWWDTEEDAPAAKSFTKQDPGKSSSGASKSFMKQNKPPETRTRLATPLESDEFEHMLDDQKYNKPTTVRFEDLDVENIPRLSLDNSSISSSLPNKGEKPDSKIYSLQA